MIKDFSEYPLFYKNRNLHLVSHSSVESKKFRETWDHIRERFTWHLGKLKMDKTFISSAELVFNEIMDNAITYGYKKIKDRGQSSVNISALIIVPNLHRIIITVEDEATPIPMDVISEIEESIIAKVNSGSQHVVLQQKHGGIGLKCTRKLSQELTIYRLYNEPGVPFHEVYPNLNRSSLNDSREVIGNWVTAVLTEN